MNDSGNICAELSSKENADQTFDARGLNCPQPILQTKLLLNQLEAGTTLQVWATDPGSVLDFRAFCRLTGNELLEMSEEDGLYGFLIRKESQAKPHKPRT